MKVAVVIPFYQREAGLLATAVASVAAQRLAHHALVDIVIVDDGSPVTAASEALPALPDNFALRIIRRDNGGVSSARNVGLDALAQDTRYVAFLDSDDCWLPGHLASGVAALTAGADFYFDNTIEEDGRDHLSFSEMLRQRHGKLDPDDPITASFDGRAIFDVLLSEHIPQTSQVIYDFQRHKSTRFDESLKLASEDYLFWLSLAQQSERLTYHTEIMGRRGCGVSIYRSTLAWGSRQGLGRIVDQIKMRRLLISRFGLDPHQVKRVDDEIAELCDQVTFLAVRNSYRHPRTIVTELRRLTQMYPEFWQRVPSAIIGLSMIRSRLLQGWD